MSEKRKRTERKSQSLRSKHGNTQQDVQANTSQEHADQSSRVMDMSWAAKYLDDDWEGKYSQKGGYDTKANAHAQTLAMNGGGFDMMSQTQQFKPVDADEAAEEFKIRDAVTDKTIVGFSQTEAVRDAVHSETAETAGSADNTEAMISTDGDEEESEDMQFKIRDAVTDKTIVQIGEAQAVRNAVNSAEGNEEEPEETEFKIRDAVTDKTIVSSFEAQQIRDSAGTGELSMTASLEEDLEELGGIRDAATAKPQAPVEGRPKTNVSATGILTDLIVDKKTPSPEKNSATGILNELIVDTEPSAPVKSSVKKQAAKKESAGRESVKQSPERKQSGSSAQRKDSREKSVRNNQPVKKRSSEPERYRKDEERYYRQPAYAYYVPVKSPLRFIPLVLVIALCVLGFFTARTVCNDVPVNASDYSKISYTVQPGLTNDTLSEELMALGLIDNPLIFKIRCLFYDADYVPGTYELSPCYSTEKIINILSGYKYGNEE